MRAWRRSSRLRLTISSHGCTHGPLGRARLLLLVCLIVLTVGAWLLTIHQAQTMDMPMGVVVRGGAVAPRPTCQRWWHGGHGQHSRRRRRRRGRHGHGRAGWSFAGFVAFVVAWAVMMAAMMFPAAAPMLLLFRTVATQRQRTGRAFVPTWVFAAGYLLVWTAVGAVTWVLVQLASDVAGRLGGGRASDLGAARAGGGARRGRALPADPAQAGLPRPLPLARSAS